jgi:hypothetical protein
MRRVKMLEFASLDGVIQARGALEEDNTKPLLYGTSAISSSHFARALFRVRCPQSLEPKSHAERSLP